MVTLGSRDHWTWSTWRKRGHRTEQNSHTNTKGVKWKKAKQMETEQTQLFCWWHKSIKIFTLTSIGSWGELLRYSLSLSLSMHLWVSVIWNRVWPKAVELVVTTLNCSNPLIHTSSSISSFLTSRLRQILPNSTTEKWSSSRRALGISFFPLPLFRYIKSIRLSLLFASSYLPFDFLPYASGQIGFEQKKRPVLFSLLPQNKRCFGYKRMFHILLLFFLSPLHFSPSPFLTLFHLIHLSVFLDTFRSAFAFRFDLFSSLSQRIKHSSKSRMQEKKNFPNFNSLNWLGPRI